MAHGMLLLPRLLKKILRISKKDFSSCPDISKHREDIYYCTWKNFQVESSPFWQ
jgi:hypothetical protein